MVLFNRRKEHTISLGLLYNQSRIGIVWHDWLLKYFCIIFKFESVKMEPKETKTVISCITPTKPPCKNNELPPPLV